MAISEGDETINAFKMIDAQGMFIFPGVIDCHVHLNEPGYIWREDYEHGTAAAAIGGTTTVIDMPMQNKPALTDKAIFQSKEAVVSKNAYVDFCFWGGLVNYNFSDLQGLDEAGVVAFKSFLSPVSSDYTALKTGEVREALQIIKGLGARAGFHCEDYSIIEHEEKKAKTEGRCKRSDYIKSRPLSAELIATKNIIELARETEAAVHICHVSHPRIAKEIRCAQRQGIDITAETCSHYFVFSEDDYLEQGSIFKCAPPLRSYQTVEDMWEFIFDGTISCIGSDHSPSTASEKDEETKGVFGTWGGISGLQSLLQVMFSEGVNKRGYSPSLLARILSENPSKVFGIYGKKGEINIGFDADLVILDPNQEWEITAKSLKYVNKISAFVGFKGKGFPVLTMVRGEIVSKDGDVCGKKGFGKLVKKQNSLFY